MKRSSLQCGVLLVILLTCFAGAAEAAVGNGSGSGENKNPDKYFFNETWGDFSEELEKARAEGKKGIWIFFEMEECPFCHRMKNTILNQPEVLAFFQEQFLCFSIDIEGDVEIIDFQGKTITQKDFAFKVNRVRATPVFAFFDLEGNRVVRYTGATSSIEEFLWLGEYAAEGWYKKMRFTKYKQQKKKAALQVK